MSVKREWKKLVGANLRKVRSEAGMSQQELAEKMGVSTVTVCRWESGAQGIGTNNMRDLGTLFGLEEKAFLLDIPIETREFEEVEREKLIIQNIKIRRSALGLSQHDLAARSGVSLRAISDIENGIAKTRLTTLERIAHGLGCKASDMVKPIGEIEGYGGISSRFSQKRIAETGRLLLAISKMPMDEFQTLCKRVFGEEEGRRGEDSNIEI